MTQDHWIAYTDGASRGNPGLAGCGAHIIAPDGSEHNFKTFIGEATNNQAEYQALLLALRELARLKAAKVLVRADSELLIRQMIGQYKVKNANILPLFQEARRIAQDIPSVAYEHVRREYNKVADKLANEAIDER